MSGACGQAAGRRRSPSRFRIALRIAASSGNDRARCQVERSGSRMGTAPVGGTTGAVDAPCSGGEEQVRRCSTPKGSNTSIVGHDRCVRKSTPRPIPRKVVRTRGHTEANDTNRPRPRGLTAMPGPQGPAPRSRRGAVNRGPFGRPGVHPVVVAAGRRCPSGKPSISGLPARGYPSGSRWSCAADGCRRHDQVYSAAQGLGRPTACRMTDMPGAHTGTGRGQRSRPARTASAIAIPSRAAAAYASQAWPSHRATPSGVPVPYAASAPT